MDFQRLNLCCKDELKRGVRTDMKKKIGELTLREIKEIIDNNDCTKYDEDCNGCFWQHLHCGDIAQALGDLDIEIEVEVEENEEN